MQRIVILAFAAALLPAAQSFSPRVPGASPRHRSCVRQGPQQVVRSRAVEPSMFGGPGGGGFLNVGTPEMFVIGSVAWALIGPKELYKLARQAGEFLSEWRTLGAQAQAQFKEALEAELAEEEPLAPPPAPSPAASADSFPSLADMAEKKSQSAAPADVSAMEQMTQEEIDELTKNLYEEMGDPVSNGANFQEQISGKRNANVLDEYPQTLSAEEGGGWGGLDSAEENLLDTQIAEAENRLATLQAEAQVIALRKKQQTANFERAQKVAAEEEEKEEADANEQQAA